MSGESQIGGGQTLYGRSDELQALAAALRDPAARAIVARGEAGAGKTALVRAVLETARADGAIVGASKYGEGYGGRDLDPLIAAIEEAVACGLDQLFDPEAGLQDLARTLGPEARVFATLGTGLLRSVASTDAGSQLSADRADEQLVQALIQVLRWLEGFGAPVLLLLDDWGRAGSQAQRTCQRLTMDANLARTRLLATERLNEPFRAPIAARVVEVGPLSETAQLDLAREVLGERAGAAADVIAFLGEISRRPFDLIESIRVLISAQSLFWRAGAWRLDATRAAATLGGEAARALVERSLGANPDLANLAHLLAVHGDGAELSDLAAAARVPPPAAGRLFNRLAAEGLVAWNGGRVGYGHDRLRAEVLLGLEPATRRAIAAQLADALRAAGARPGDGDRGMRMLWLRQEGGLDVAEPRWWRDAFVRGAFDARQTGDQDAAERLTAAALQMAAAGAGESYDLLQEAAYVAILRGDNARARDFADRMEAYASTPVERAVAHEMRVFVRRVPGDLDGALEVARTVLSQVGVRLPRKVTAWNLALAVAKIFWLDPRRAVRPLSPQELELESPMIRAINSIGSLLFEREPLLAVVFGTRTVSRKIAYGSAAGAATYTLMCCAFGAYRRAAAWADASDRLQGPEQPLRAVAKQYSSSFGHVFVRPRPLYRSRGEEMAALAYAGGDLPVAAYGNRDKVLDAIFSDEELDATAHLADEALRVAERFSDAPTIPHVRALRQFIEQLRSGGAEAWRLEGRFYEAADGAALEAARMANVARAITAIEALLGVLYGRYEEVAALRRRSWPRYGGTPFQAQTQIWNFATGLALYRTEGRGPPFLARWNLRRLERLNPHDFRHRTRLLDAEAARARGRRRAALRFYAEAVEAAADARCPLEHGLVAAAAAEAAEALGEATLSVLWREAAIGAWRRLGAEGLVATRFPSAALAAPSVADATASDGAAERASRAKARLLAAIGHELRTPLQGALGLVELAQRPGEADHLADVRQAIAALAGVVEDLTDFGALEGGVIPVRAAPADARAVAQSLVALHAARAFDDGRRLVFETPGPPVWVLVDEGRIRQVLGNLVANALRHGQGGVRVGLEQTAEGRLRFWVADEGPALSPADMLRIFEPFERGGQAADDTGLGLGLFLSRRIARALGGDLRVTPQGTGKAFELEIRAEPVDAPVAPTFGALAGLRVLLAEDTDLSRDVLSALLRREGCQVVAVADGGAAMRALRSDAFDLLLLDHRMPSASGVEVAAAASAGPGPAPRILLMSAGYDAELEAQALRAGAQAVLRKPVSIAQLRGAVGATATATASEDRLVELRRTLGLEAEPLIAALEPALERELARLEILVGQADAAGIEAQTHRLRGLAAHFGVSELTRALDSSGSPGDAVLRARAALSARMGDESRHGPQA